MEAGGAIQSQNEATRLTDPEDQKKVSIWKEGSLTQTRKVAGYLRSGVWE